jgi:hypothetical protein
VEAVINVLRTVSEPGQRDPSEADQEKAGHALRVLWHLTPNGRQCLRFSPKGLLSQRGAADGRTAIARHGGVNAIIEAMRSHKASADVAEHGTRALWDLMDEGRSAVRRATASSRRALQTGGRAAIFRAGGVEIVINALRRHTSCHAIALQACGALADATATGSCCA